MAGKADSDDETPTPLNGSAPRRRLPAESRRAHLLDSARRAFLADGFTAVGMRQIAAVAEVDAALLYRHFPSKQALFEAAVLEPLQGLAKELMAEGEGLLRSPLVEKPVHFRHGLTRLLEVMTEIGPLIAIGLFSDPKFGRRVYNEEVAPLLKVIAEAVEEDLQTWAQRPVDAQLMVTSVFTMCFGLALDADYQSQPLDPDQVAGELADVLMRGMFLPTTPERSAAKRARKR